MQYPLVNEGLTVSTADGRFAQNLRIVAFDIATGKATGQYAYQLESLIAINSRLPVGQTFANNNSQGRNIGVSSITPINNNDFSVTQTGTGQQLDV
jgi:Esterase-like activity of phytase